MPLGVYPHGGQILAGESRYGFIVFGPSPSSPASSPEDTNDLLSWEVTISLDQGSSARITLSNPDNKYDNDDFIGQQISLHTLINGVNKQWFRGEITSLEPSNDMGGVEKTMVFQCMSHFYDLDKKPVNTQKYTDATGQEILEELLGVYGGVDSAFYDFAAAATTSFSNIVIQEDSILLAAQKIAQACDLEIYVNRFGKLVAVGQNAGGDIELDSSKILSWSPRRSVEEGFSVVRVRGRFLSVVEDGTSDFYNDDLTVFSPIVTTELFVDLGTTATDTELMSASYSSSTANTSIFLNQVLGNGFVRLRVVKTGGAFFSIGQNTFNVTINGLRLWSAEFTSISNQASTSPKSRVLATLSAQRENLRTERRFIQWDNRSPKPKDEREESRIEIVGNDAELIEEFGIRWGEVDNAYIPTLDVALTVALREFSNFKKSRKTYTIQTTDDSLDVNTTLTLVGDEPPAPKILGVRELRVHYDASGPSFQVDVAAEELPVA